MLFVAFSVTTSIVPCGLNPICSGDGFGNPLRGLTDPEMKLKTPLLLRVKPAMFPEPDASRTYTRFLEIVRLIGSLPCELVMLFQTRASSCTLKTVIWLLPGLTVSNHSPSLVSASAPWLAGFEPVPCPPVEKDVPVEPS